MIEKGCKLMWGHAGVQEPGPRRQLNIALGILLPAPMLAQEDEQGCAAAAYHQLLRLSVCPPAAFGQARRGPSVEFSGLLRSFDAAGDGGGDDIWEKHLISWQQ